MWLQHNMMMISAYRNYTNNVFAMKKNLEKLFSGRKINRAGDAAAGLAIPEKMRAQITGGGRPEDRLGRHDRGARHAQPYGGAGGHVQRNLRQHH